MEQKELIDLGFIGPKFTWNHNSSLENRKSARLDCGLCDDRWRRLIPIATITHLPHSHSNHCPLLLRLEESKRKRMGDRPFRFHAA